MQDIRFGFRLIARQPGLAAVIVATLALGIGLNTAMFSIVNAVILRPLPYPEPDRLVWMYGSFALNDSAAISPPDFLDYRERNRVFASMGAMVIGTSTANLAGSGAAERIPIGRVSANLFPTLGARPVIGRGFSATDERYGSPPVAVLSFETWRDRFAEDPAILGTTISLDGEATTVVGVVPKGFQAPFDSRFGLAPEAAIWTPIRFGSPDTSVRRFHFLRAVGRLRPGVTLNEAQAGMDVVARQLEAAYRENESWKLRLVPLHEEVVGPVRPLLLILQAVLAVLLLVACANVAILLLARASAREGEVAVRALLGASRSRLLRQLLTESLALASLGAGVGLGASAAALSAFRALAPANLPRVAEISLDVRVLAFTAAVGLAAALACGLAPALHLSRPTLSSALNAAARGGSRAGRARTQNVLLVAQIAASVVLLVAAGLLVRSLSHMQSVHLGFDPTRVVTANILLPETVYDSDPKVLAFFDSLLERVRALPGVERAGAVTILPLTGGTDTSVYVEGHPPVSDRQKRYVQARVVTGDVLGALRIPVVAGRAFDEGNPQEAARSVVINRCMAEEFFPGEHAVGRRLVLDIGRPTALQVIGIVGDVREWGPASDAPPVAYINARTAPSPSMNLAVRVDADDATLAIGLREAMRRTDAGIALASIRPMVDLLGLRMAEPRLRTLLIAGFAVIGLLLTLVGLYGALAFSVAQRTREIGIRLALGAPVEGVRSLLVRQGTALVLAGLAIGLVIAFWATRLLSALLFAVQPRDPVVFGAVSAVLVLGGLAAVAIPAHRATRVDPALALRE